MYVCEAGLQLWKAGRSTGFKPDCRSVHPTLAAAEVFAVAERMLSDAHGLSRRMRDLVDARGGRVAFLASAGTASALMPRVIASFRAAHPDIEIDQFPELIAKHLTRPAIERQVSLLQRAGRTLSPAASAFVTVARKTLARAQRRDIP